MKRFVKTAARTGICTAAVLALLSACGHMATGPAATARLQPTQGSQTSGQVQFESLGDRVRISGEVRGLAPGKTHGFHVHEKGDCSAPDAMSAAGHFNPDGKPHGSPGGSHSHAGDLPNLKADANGNANYSAKVHGITVNTGPTGIVGRSVVIHRDPDDYKSQPAGNSGPRIACGLIK